MNRTLLLTAAALLGFAGAASAQDLELSVAVVSTQSQPIRIGDMVTLDVTLTNKGDKASGPLKDLTFDRQSVWLELTIGDKTFKDQQIRRAVNDIVSLTTFSLEPKASRSLLVELPVLRKGSLKVAAIYAGGPNPAEVLRSPSLDLGIEGKNGEDEVQVKLVTDRGVVMLRLFADKALGTCNNFVRLIRSNYYNGLIFHRIIDGFMIQGGCPNGTGMGGPGYNIPTEYNDVKHDPGVLSMAQSTPGGKPSIGSQFFICTGQPYHLNGKYTAFGKVVKGLDVVQFHGKTKTSAGSRPLKDQRMRRLTLVP